MKRITKKGVGTGTLVAIILTLAVLAPVTFFAYTAMEKQSSGIAMKDCQLSILKASEQKKYPGSQGRVYTPLNCQRDKLGDLVISKKDVVGKDDKIDQYQASKIIADAMAECWQMIGEGKRDPFSNWDEEGSYCMICRTIRFDDTLKNYYQETFTDSKKQEKRGLDGVILSPIPYMLDKKNTWIINKENYFSYIYNTENPEKLFSKQETDNMKKMIVSDGTAIMIKMYKQNDKDTLATIATWGAVIVGIILIIVGVALTLTGAGSVVGVPLAATGTAATGATAVGAAAGATAAGVAATETTIAATAVTATFLTKVLATALSVGKLTIIAGGILLVTGGVSFAGVAMFDPVNLNPFSECQECNGVGSIKLVPPEFDLRQEWQVTYPKEITKTGEDIKESGPYCMHLVN